MFTHLRRNRENACRRNMMLSGPTKFKGFNSRTATGEVGRDVLEAAVATAAVELRLVMSPDDRDYIYGSRFIKQRTRMQYDTIQRQFECFC